MRGLPAKDGQIGRAACRVDEPAGNHRVLVRIPHQAGGKAVSGYCWVVENWTGEEWIFIDAAHSREVARAVAAYERKHGCKGRYRVRRYVRETP